MRQKEYQIRVMLVLWRCSNVENHKYENQIAMKSKRSNFQTPTEERAAATHTAWPLADLPAPPNLLERLVLSYAVTPNEKS